MWKRKQEDYRSLMDHLNNDANYITMQLDTIATPRVSALDGGQEHMSRNSFLEAKRANASRHGSVGPDNNNNTTSMSSRRSVSSAAAAIFSPINGKLFGNTVMPKEVQLRGDAVAALAKVAQLLQDKNTPPQLEMSLLDKGYQLIESLRTSRERINRKNIKKGSYLTLMSALDKRAQMSAKGATSGGAKGRGRGGGIGIPKNGGLRMRSSSLSSEGLEESTPVNPWCRVIEQNYWWSHHIHSVMGLLEERAFENSGNNSRGPSPIPLAHTHSRSLCVEMEDPIPHSLTSLTGAVPASTAANSAAAFSSVVGFGSAHVSPAHHLADTNDRPNTAGGALDLSDGGGRDVSMPADNNEQNGAAPESDPYLGLSSRSLNRISNANNKTPNMTDYLTLPSSPASPTRAANDSFAQLFYAHAEPTSAEVPPLFYDESDLAMHALEMISDEEMRRPGNSFKLTGTKRCPSVVSEDYNQGLREHFIHAVHSEVHPMAKAIEAFMRYNASAILRIAIPDNLNVHPTNDSTLEMWDIWLDTDNGGNANTKKNTKNIMNTNSNNNSKNFSPSSLSMSLRNGGRSSAGLGAGPHSPTVVGSLTANQLLSVSGRLSVGGGNNNRGGGGSGHLGVPGSVGRRTTSGSTPLLMKGGSGGHLDPQQSVGGRNSMTVGSIAKRNQPVGSLIGKGNRGSELPDNAEDSSGSSDESEASGPNRIKCRWGIVPSIEYEKQYLRDRLQFIQALCETVLSRMFSDKHIPVVVTSTHVDGQSVRSIDKMSPVRKSRGGRGGGGDNQSERGSLFGGAERNSADGSTASSVRPSSSATYSGTGGSSGRPRTAIDLSFPFSEVLPEIIDSKLELLAVRSVFRWAEAFEANRKKAQTDDDVEEERMKIGSLTPNLIRDSSSRLLLEGAACKLSEFLKSIAEAIEIKDLIFVDELYDRLIDALMITYNIAETSRVKMAGTHAGADDVFPCIVYIIGTSRTAFLISALLKWSSVSTVACRLPPFLSKGAEAYVLQSFMAAANAVVGCITKEGPHYF